MASSINLVSLLSPFLFTNLFFMGGARAQDVTSGPWVMQSSGTKASLRGVHTVCGGVAWASGTSGTVLRTEDGGYMWQSCALPPGSGKFDFRGIWAWDAQTAIVMSSGPGDQSRLYKTTDGCSSWKLLYTNPDKDGFWDAVVFSEQNRGIVLGDPVPVAEERASLPIGRFALFETFDGTDWRPVPNAYRPIAGPKETGAFAASNSSLVVSTDSDLRRILVGGGGKNGAKIYESFEMLGSGLLPFPRQFEVPITSGADSSGVFSLGFRDDKHGVAVGGDYTKPNESAGTAAWTADGGAHWSAATKPPHGYRSAVAWDADAKAWIAVGTNGSDLSYDDGKTWSPLDGGNWNALSLPWVVGPEGRIAKLGTLPKTGSQRTVTAEK
jgi:photosystem II stability/assembly factor-like uncharacterized protein